MIHQLNTYMVNERLESFRKETKSAQLKRSGYRDVREPRKPFHWANR